MLKVVFLLSFAPALTLRTRKHIAFQSTDPTLKTRVGKSVSEIPQQHTTPHEDGTCGTPKPYAMDKSGLPPPVLADCITPLAPGVPDLRGFWKGSDAKGRTTVEEIEQCGDRVVIRGTSGVIHDVLHADGKLKNGYYDYSAPYFPRCFGVYSTAKLEGSCYMEHPLGIPNGNSRCLNPDGSMTLVWAKIPPKNGVVFKSKPYHMTWSPMSYTPLNGPIKRRGQGQ